MADSRFSFIKDDVLRQNLNEVFEHILQLLTFTGLLKYDEIAKSAFRKTIIIHTASIIEALLFHIIDTKLSDEDLESFSWELRNKEVLYVIDDTYEIVAGDYKKITKAFR